MRSKFTPHGINVAKLHESDLVRLVERSVDLFIVGHFNGSARAPVESFAEGKHALASSVEGGYLDGIFVGFGSAVHEEELVIIIT